MITYSNIYVLLAEAINALDAHEHGTKVRNETVTRNQI